MEDLGGPAALPEEIDRRRLLQASLAVAAGSIGTAAFADEAAPSPVVVTEAGRVQGFQADGVQHFLGVPYGAPTGGPNRFMPPQKPAPWTEVRPATAYGPVSPQLSPSAPPGSGPLGHMHDPPPAGQSEDCLNLNIWTPGADGAHRPVMFWIHGGGYFNGSGSMAVYNGAKLARRGDVVVINVTHRLNVLGYTYLGEAGGEAFAHSGIVGIMDIVQALEWVRDNIDRFGGDPGKVMIFGESGGGGKVSTLLAMPSARGLFRNAIIESGSNIFLPERPEAATVAGDFMARVGLGPDQARALQAIPLWRLMAGYFNFAGRRPTDRWCSSRWSTARCCPASPATRSRRSSRATCRF